MLINDLALHYDGICVYVTITKKASLVAKIILSFINLALLSVIVIFSLERVFIGAIVFSGVEIFIVKYTLWNLFGEERVIINAKSISYQQHYGFFTTSWHTIPFNKRITIVPYKEFVEKDQKCLDFQLESYNENNLPNVIYHSVLSITDTDFEKLLQYIDRIFVDEMVESYEMPKIYLN